MGRSERKRTPRGPATSLDDRAVLGPHRELDGVRRRLIAVEKTAPWRRVATYGTAAILLVLGLLVLVAPEAIPALTIPEGPMAPGMG